MQIHGHWRSGCTRRVLATWFEVRDDAPEFVQVALEKREQKGPEHLQRHPFGRVPVLVDGDFVLYESQAIMRHIAQGTALVPNDAKRRATMDQFLSASLSYLATPASLINRNIMVVKLLGLPSNPEEIERGRSEVAEVLSVYERTLADREYLAGPVSLADLDVLPTLQMLVDLKQDDLLENTPHVRAWSERLRARASWQRVLAMAAPR
jgi:glutathione S-transferase